MQPDYIHIVGDGRGVRDVYLDGVMLHRVVYADTRRGLVKVHDDPIRVVGDRIIPHKKYGRVKVVDQLTGRKY